VVGKSSTESEFISVSSPVMWSRNYLIEQGYPQLPALNKDNSSTIYLALKGQSDSKKTKHIERNST
jgi:hypothetical protein